MTCGGMFVGVTRAFEVGAGHCIALHCMSSIHPSIHPSLSCRRHGLAEARLYEMAKLRAQFAELLTDAGILRYDVRPASGTTQAVFGLRLNPQTHLAITCGHRRANPVAVPCGRVCCTVPENPEQQGGWWCACHDVRGREAVHTAVHPDAPFCCAFASPQR